ncbi:arrestin [Fusarium albosuccineum]|uniref:Arrestin n=1 Tax=Fusarium albosuccineum TaxID=1237068 RepID=A0A8H4KPY0_9HYPO|nr:arrestin [Fusarium albosuccineum]
MEIVLDQHFQSRVYTPGSNISGRVVVKSPHDVLFDDLEISLTGVATTRAYFVNPHAPSISKTFLTLNMPTRDLGLPPSKVFEANQTYTLPFNFVLPHELAIDRAKKPSPLEASRKIKVLPIVLEEAPMNITDNDERYILSKTRTIRQNIFLAKSGDLTVTAFQPGAVLLTAEGHCTSRSTLRVDLKFDPACSLARPPSINNVDAEIHALTFFSTAPIDRLPYFGAYFANRVPPILNYTHTNTIQTAIITPTWSQRPRHHSSSPPIGSRPCAGASEQHDAQTASEGKKKTKEILFFYTASLDIHLKLPSAKNQLFLPSFDSCLISRAYIIHLGLFVGPAKTKIALDIPLQVAVERPFDNELPSFQAVVAEAQRESIESHHSLSHNVSPEGREDSNALPSYEDLGR